MKKAKFFLLGLISVSFLFVLVEKSSLREISPFASLPKNLYLLETVFRHVRNDYIHEIDPDRVIQGSFRGLINSLDSCSGYLNPRITSIHLTRKGNIPAEPGLILYKKYGSFPAVVGIVEGSPAEKAGLQLGDAITEINRESTAPMSLIEVQLLLEGKEKETADLKLLRGEKTLEMKVGRAVVRADEAFYSEKEGLSGILKIVRLAPPLVTNIKTKLLPRLKNHLDKPLVIDLRTCPEGTFDEGRHFVNLFLKVESMGYLTKGGEKKEHFLCPEEPIWPDLPLLVWVSQATQGPAEAVAAALKEIGRAKVVGVPTLGLAAQSDFFPLPDGSSILLTSGIFSLPSGISLWGQGVEPDIFVEGKDLSLNAYLNKSKSLGSRP